MPTGRANPCGFLIDEDLSPELADLAAARGHPTLAITRLPKLKGRGDAVVARFAIERELVLVTNDLVDFRRLYISYELHPGLVFICAEHTKLRTKAHQKQMMSAVLDEIANDALLQEALRITAFKDGKGVAYRLERFHLPELAQAGKGPAHGDLDCAWR